MSKLRVYRASAGSGKTYQLALKYITLLLGQWNGDTYRLFKGDDLRRHREILAITFTNKATQEMRSRIVKELALLSDLNADSGYRKDIHLMVAPDETDLLDKDIDRRVSEAARHALDSMLFDFGEMQVSTIDAFFQRVLRSFAYEADLAGNYDLMLENDRMTDMAISNMLAMACGMKGVVMPRGVNVGYIRQRIGTIVCDQVAKGGEYKIFSADSSLRADMVKFVKQLSDEDYQAKKADIDAFLAKPNAIPRLVEALKAKRDELLLTVNERVDLVLKSEAAAKLSANARKMFDKICSGEIDSLTPTNLALLLPDAAYGKLLNKNKFTDDVVRFFESAVESVFDVVRTLLSINLLLRNVNFLGLFREILVVQQSLKSHLNTILLSDTNELLRLIIDDSETPFIYERIGRKLHHFLIDEFQDTSRLQWQNLLPLLSESLGNGNENLIIGDVKQCIYRFRNSNPELLAHDIDRNPRISPYIEHCSLDSNWRSAPEIVEFNNGLFEKVGQRADVQHPKADAYQTVRQIARNNKISGYVDIALTAKDKLHTPGFTRMVEHMARQLRSGYTPGDIVVLVRTRSDAHAVVEALLQAGRDEQLPPGTMVLSDEALYVASARSVQWIVAQLQEMNAMPQKQQRINSRGLPSASQQDIDWLQEHLLTIAKDSTVDNPLEKAIADFNARRQEAGSSDNAMKRRLQRASGQSLFEIVEELIRNLPDDNLRHSEAQYISAFQDLVLDYCRQTAPTLQGFLKLWDDELADKAAVGLAEGVDAVRVMTIHKSKGLEFGCVHIPILDNVIDSERNNRWYDVREFFSALGLEVDTPGYYPIKPNSGINPQYTAFACEFRNLKDDQTIDEINALYVAFTRACQELIVTITDPRSESKKGGELPLNHPSGLICPLLSAMTEPSANNTWKFGEPTQKYVKPSGQGADRQSPEYMEPLILETYETRMRENIWSQTKAANVSDSGEII